MVAAENGALPGGKVGGIGDVIRDLPLALAARGWQPEVLTPAYGKFHTLPGAVQQDEVPVDFGGQRLRAGLWSVPGSIPRVTHWVLEHPLFSPHGPGQIYCNDPGDRPFATDAGKFAFFSAAVAAFILRNTSRPAVVHLHDWHTACYLLLRAYAPGYRELQALRTVFTIHNLAFQGIRPLSGDASSLTAWFPGLPVPHANVIDPRYPDCINPMATAIRLADRVNTVSPTYAQEILRPSQPEHGFSGGEGLETELIVVAESGRLSGILNGCEYPATAPRRIGWERALKNVSEALQHWQQQTGATAHAESLAQLAALPRRRPGIVLISVGRLTMQKIALLLQETTQGIPALTLMLNELGKQGVFILLGSGDAELQERMQALAKQHTNFIYLSGYSESLADVLYRSGDLFLMPSSFEPCGISQLLAMRAGSPCVVHGVGGLRDTVHDGVTGFVFDGDTPAEQAENLVASVRRARQVKGEQPQQWRTMCTQAAAARFSWDSAAAAYEQQVYERAAN